MQLKLIAPIGLTAMTILPLAVYWIDSSVPSGSHSGQKPKVYEVEPPGSLYEGCRISWGKKLCGEEAQKPDADMPVRYEAKSEAAYASAPREKVCVATPEKFARINSNLSMQTIQQIMGCNGELVSEFNMDGQRMRTYVWHGQSPGSRIIAVFYGWRTQGISQIGMANR